MCTRRFLWIKVNRIIAEVVDVARIVAVVPVDDIQEVVVGVSTSRPLVVVEKVVVHRDGVSDAVVVGMAELVGARRNQVILLAMKVAEDPEFSLKCADWIRLSRFRARF